MRFDGEGYFLEGKRQKGERGGHRGAVAMVTGNWEHLLGFQDRSCARRARGSALTRRLHLHPSDPAWGRTEWDCNEFKTFTCIISSSSHCTNPLQMLASGAWLGCVLLVVSTCYAERTLPKNEASVSVSGEVRRSGCFQHRSAPIFTCATGGNGSGRS